MNKIKNGDLVTPIYNLIGFKNLLKIVNTELTEEEFPQLGSSYRVREIGPYGQTVALEEFKGNHNLIGGEYMLPLKYFINFFDGYEYFLRANINIRRPGWREIVQDHIYDNPKRPGFFKPPHPRMIKPYKEYFHNETKKKQQSNQFEKLVVEYSKISKLSIKELHIKILQFFSLKDCIKMLEYSISNNLSFPSLDDGRGMYNIYMTSTNE